MTSSPFTPDDLYRHISIADVDCSRKDALAACAVEVLDKQQDSSCSNLWTFPLDGSGAPLQMTRGPSNDQSPRWSPDGSELGFVSDRAGNNQVFLMPLHGGEPRQCTHLSGAVVTFEWSPDGKTLALACSLQVDPGLRGARMPAGASPPSQTAPQVAWKLPFKVDGAGFILSREVHLFTVDVASGEANQLTDGPFDVRAVSWTHDGKSILYTRTREGDESHRTDVWIMDRDGGNRRQLTTEQSQVLYPVASPDGRYVVFSGTIEEGDAQVRLWCIDMQSGEVSGLGDENIEISSEGDSLQFMPGDSTRVYAVVARRGAQEVVEIALPGGEVRILAGGDRQCSKLACSQGALVYTSETPVSFMELYTCGLDGGNERRLSSFNQWYHEKAAATMERRSFIVPDGDGGTQKIEGWFIRPAGVEGPTPLLVDIHGGPASYVLFNYSPVAYWSLLWSRGWSVLALNAVGSASFGREHADRLCGRWGELDLPQHLAAVHQLRSEGLADERIGICGKSYGGFMSAWAIGHSQEFRAAVVMAPVANIETHYGTSDSGFYSDPYALGGDRKLNRETMRRLSPTQYAENATTPTLILQGDSDQRCPSSQSEELFVSMRRGANPPCELVIYPGGSHKFTATGTPSHRVDAMTRICDWMSRWVDQAQTQLERPTEAMTSDSKGKDKQDEAAAAEAPAQRR